MKGMWFRSWGGEFQALYGSGVRNEYINQIGLVYIKKK